MLRSRKGHVITNEKKIKPRDLVQPLCVLESDFGFKINCAFKKSGLFRVRNLGGIKAHASLGFSLGDELGFEQSLTNLDPSRRRSVSFKNGAPNVIVDTPSRPAAKQEKRAKQNRIMMRPMPSPPRTNQAAMDKLSTLHRRASTMQPIVVQPSVSSVAARPAITLAKPMPMGVPPFRPLPPKEDTLKVLPITKNQPQAQPKGPGIAFASEKANTDDISRMVAHMTAVQYSQHTPAAPISSPALNPFVPLPEVAVITPHRNTNTDYLNTHKLSNSVDPVPQAHAGQVISTKADDYNTISGYGDDTALKFSKEDINEKIAEIAKAGNISTEAVEAAIALRQQQLLSKYASIPVTTVTTTTTTATEPPLVFQQPEPEIIVASVQQKPKRNPTAGKVMNAPREYYPIGYEKNFDDHFQSKVELPDTSFHCGDQKYFPGLYGDENLGCMVFHVCALTDDGLVMKSFLCPESTLFDQAILKCNWWFYVDCKSTERLYDTNIPVSKSYQLMKALTFFSSYRKEMQDGNSMQPEEVNGIKEAINILDSQDSKAAQSTGGLHIITPQPIIVDERSRQQYTTDAPVYRGQRGLAGGNATAKVDPTPQASQAAEASVAVRANVTASNSSTIERKHRRRMTLTSSRPLELTTFSSPLVDIMKQEIRPFDESRRETMADQLDEAQVSSPARRVHRSSAERESEMEREREREREREMETVNDERVMIVRPTRLGPEFPSPNGT
ncbi:unnamed protein product, partial [Iphiclides podalirius]